jgi:Fe2+ transport system protein FeoA
MPHMTVNKLSELPVGMRGKVTRIDAKGHVKKRILEMGLTTGSEVQVTGIAPFGDPMNLLVKGYHLSLRKKEAELVLIEDARESGNIR